MYLYDTIQRDIKAFFNSKVRACVEGKSRAAVPKFEAVAVYRDRVTVETRFAMNNPLASHPHPTIQPSTACQPRIEGMPCIQKDYSGQF